MNTAQQATRKALIGQVAGLLGGQKHGGKTKFPGQPGPFQLGKAKPRKPKFGAFYR